MNTNIRVLNDAGRIIIVIDSQDVEVTKAVNNFISSFLAETTDVKGLEPPIIPDFHNNILIPEVQPQETEEHEVVEYEQGHEVPYNNDTETPQHSDSNCPDDSTSVDNQEKENVPVISDDNQNPLYEALYSKGFPALVSLFQHSKNLPPGKEKTRAIDEAKTYLRTAFADHAADITTLEDKIDFLLLAKLISPVDKIAQELCLLDLDSLLALANEKDIDTVFYAVCASLIARGKS